MDAIPKTGMNTMGRSEVAAIGIDSKIHHVAINIANAVVFQAMLFMPSGEGKNNSRINKINPRNRPVLEKFRLNCNRAPMFTEYYQCNYKDSR